MPVTLGLGSLTEKEVGFWGKKSPLDSVHTVQKCRSILLPWRERPAILTSQAGTGSSIPYPSFVKSDYLTAARMNGHASLRLHMTYSVIWRLEVVNMIMQALVISVQRDRLLVLDFATRRRVIVITPDARRFRQGNIVRIRYNGVMTNSIPPQIFALNIFALPGGGPWCNRC